MSIESQARWYATKLILTYLSIIATLVVIGYIDLFYLFVVVMTLFALSIAGAIFSDAYYSKLVELQVKKYEK
ncbi:MAG: hypothetical protein EB049_05685 [Actinobacteria bacterium]|nr:hypothetical protein [Actinomycetota bacterium]